MRITYDPANWENTLRERGLDLADAMHVFASRAVHFVDDRHEYGERRMVTYGYLNGRMVAVVWTGDELERRIISMRKANEREQRRLRDRLR